MGRRDSAVCRPEGERRLGETLTQDERVGPEPRRQPVFSVLSALFLDDADPEDPAFERLHLDRELLPRFFGCVRGGWKDGINGDGPTGGGRRLPLDGADDLVRGRFCAVPVPPAEPAVLARLEPAPVYRSNEFCHSKKCQ